MKIVTRCVVLLMLFAGLAVANAQELTGKEIMRKVYNRDDGNDSHVKTEMILVDKRGNERKRLLEMMTRDNGELVNTFLEFTSPADIEGTRFLTLENKGKDDTQYLYLPALGRSRRIVGGQKKASFVNTDFTYEDMERRHPDEDKHVLLRQETFAGFNCFVVQSISIKKSGSQYSKTIAWVDKNSMMIVRVDFYDKKGRKKKQLFVNRLEMKSGIWTAMDVVMQDLKRKTKTSMKVLDVKYNQGLDNKVFTLRHLEEER